MTSPKQVTREGLAGALKGITITIPDLEAMVAHWPRAVNVHREELRLDVNRRMESLFPAGHRLKKMKKADAASFSSSWWPYASFEELRIVTHLSTWLFAWDDETDSAEFSDLIHDFEKANRFREETISFIRACLTGNKDTSTISSKAIITDFGPIGDAVRAKYTHEQASEFCNELVYFVRSTEVEHCVQISGHLPTAEEYMLRRMGSSAVTACLALTEFCYGMQIPRSIMVDECMRLISDATNIIISLMNDILSIKKEVAQGQVDTILPLLFLKHGSIHRAIDITTCIIEDSVQSLDTAAERLLEKYTGDSAVQSDLQKYIEGCKYACTGNLSWSLRSDRFGVCEQSTRGGIHVRL